MTNISEKSANGSKSEEEEPSVTEEKRNGATRVEKSSVTTKTDAEPAKCAEEKHDPFDNLDEERRSAPDEVESGKSNVSATNAEEKNEDRHASVSHMGEEHVVCQRRLVWWRRYGGFKKVDRTWTAKNGAMSCEQPPAQMKKFDHVMWITLGGKTQTPSSTDAVMKTERFRCGSATRCLKKPMLQLSTASDELSCLTREELLSDQASSRGRRI